MICSSQISQSVMMNKQEKQKLNHDNRAVLKETCDGGEIVWKKSC